MNDLPVSTRWVMDATATTDHEAIKSVFMVYSHVTNQKGTGFAINAGWIVTNEHVVRGCKADQIFANSALGEEIEFLEVIVDSKRDLALLKPKRPISCSLEIGSSDDLALGDQVATWGYPLAYNGPPPLLSVGYVSGLKSLEEDGLSLKRIIVNGAFNSGNSGGPLLKFKENKVIGVVVSKHLPMNKIHLDTLNALANNKYGQQYTAYTATGEDKLVSESFLVAELLQHFRSLTQVMLGEAIHTNDLQDFLRENRAL